MNLFGVLLGGFAALTIALYSHGVRAQDQAADIALTDIAQVVANIDMLSELDIRRMTSLIETRSLPQGLRGAAYAVRRATFEIPQEDLDKVAEVWNSDGAPENAKALAGVIVELNLRPADERRALLSELFEISIHTRSNPGHGQGNLTKIGEVIAYIDLPSAEDYRRLTEISNNEALPEGLRAMAGAVSKGQFAMYPADRAAILAIKTNPRNLPQPPEPAPFAEYLFNINEISAEERWDKMNELFEF